MLGVIKPHGGSRGDQTTSPGRVLVCCPLTVLLCYLCRPHIPTLTELPLSACGCKKSALDVFDDHVSTCTVHSGSKKTHDWSVEQLPDLFHTTHRVKTQQVSRSRGQRCGDIELAVYLTNTAGPVPLVLDLLITHEKFGSRSDPSINGHLHYPHDLDRSLNEAVADKIRQYRADYNNRPSHTIAFMSGIDGTSGSLHREFV